MLIHIVYASEATAPFGPGELHRLLDRARIANSKADVTGMLLHTDASFFQVLEGDDRVVGALFDKISGDPRHRRVVKIVEEPLAARVFGGWSMGYTGASRAELARIEGLNDFFAGGRALVDLPPGQARKLLERFREGRWRRRAA